MVKIPVKDTIDYVFDSGADGPLNANAQLIGNSFSDIRTATGRDNRTDSNEIMEVERIEVLPPVNDDGTIDTFESIRLRDGEEFYPNIRYRNFMMGFKNASINLTTPALGVPVLSGRVNPANNALMTATPKFGPDTQVQVAVNNDDTQVDQSFRVRLHVWRFKGSQAELQQYLASTDNLSASVQQDISVSNRHKDQGQSYSSDQVNINQTASEGAHVAFTQLKGGVNQSFPKVWPWVTWSENANPTQPNKSYAFTTDNQNVDNEWQRLFYDFTDGKSAVTFDYVMAKENVTGLQDLGVSFDSRSSEHDPEFIVEPNDAHQLPFVTRYDGTRPNASPGSVPVYLQDALANRQFLWNDGGGIRVQNDGTQIPAGDILLGVQGRKLELEG